MKTLFASMLVAAAAIMAAVAAQAMPFVSDNGQDSIVIQVAGGCGVGWHRDFFGRCVPNYGGYYYGPGPGYYYGAPCGGRGTHRVCNAYGRCWRVCN